MKVQIFDKVHYNNLPVVVSIGYALLVLVTFVGPPQNLARQRFVGFEYPVRILGTFFAHFFVTVFQAIFTWHFGNVLKALFYHFKDFFDP